MIVSLATLRAMRALDELVDVSGWVDSAIFPAAYMVNLPAKFIDIRADGFLRLNHDARIILAFSKELGK